MKHIAMWMGNGPNETGWAKIMSAAGPVFLVQGGPKPRISTWENGQQTRLETRRPLTRWLLMDRIFFGFFSAIQLMRLTLKHTHGEPVALLIVDGPRGLFAMWMKWMGKVRTLVSVHSDHLPLAGSLPVRLHRRFNLTLNRFIARHADEVWRLSPRIPIGERHPHNYVVPVYINDNKIPLETRRDIVYVGIPSPDHALDVLFDVARRHDIPLHIVGDSPYLRSIQMLAPPKTEFHGYVTDPVQIREIVRRCFCGYAVYRNTGPENYSYYGIPSKPFHYFANNVPVLITNTAHFSQYIEKHGVGCVVPPDPEKIERAILEMQKRSEEFYLAITRFRVEWNQDTEKFIAKRMAALLA